MRLLLDSVARRGRLEREVSMAVANQQKKDRGMEEEKGGTKEEQSI